MDDLLHPANPQASHTLNTLASPEPLPPTQLHQIRTAAPADKKFLDHLQKKFSNQIGFLPTQAIDKYLAAERYALALENDEPAGYILSRPALTWRPELATITQAAVAMDAQRRHAGLALLAHVIAQLDKTRTVGVQAICRVGLESNEFWKAAGFVPVCHLRGENARNKDLIVWRLPLVRKLPLWFAAPPMRAGYRAAPPRLDRDSTRSISDNAFARRFISAGVRKAPAKTKGEVQTREGLHQG